ncbi:MAG: Undecaprenyl-phosphate 4-deoxy-4-formamido-L-arabinose transferase [Anaerolineales bacterium]|nr:Undecaprenyl-phosphate 4-deoxy-4-formamido-L-arabinose transferase [Anaerolineales bacterium]WKZ47762.1 MAG: glycosyltransferase [Anaerolineales bacterium]
MPAISVIIPNYNQAHFLSNSIQSVLNQTFQDFEIIVVDDGSVDNSHEIANQFGNKVQCIRQENQGLAGARNTGIRASTGEVIGLLDADDEWMPGFLETMVGLVDENPDGAVFYCMAQCIDILGKDLPQQVGGPPVPADRVHQVLLRQNFIIPSTVLFRRKPIVEAGMFDATLRSCEDWDMWLRLLPSLKLIGSPMCLVRYRVHGSSLSTNVQGMQDATRKVVEKHFGFDDRNPPSWSAEKRRAYGGMYRYQTISFIQRENNWKSAQIPLLKALQTDPSLASDLSFFYDLALGTQPVGYRGRGDLHEFETNAFQLENALYEACKTLDLVDLCGKARGTCYFALGLVCYNLGEPSKSRGYFLKALFHRPELILDFRVTGNFLKSFIRKDDLVKIKKLTRPFS